MIPKDARFEVTCSICGKTRLIGLQQIRSINNGMVSGICHDCAMKKLAQDPEWIRNHTESLKKLAQNPEWVRKHKEISENPEYIKNQKYGSKKRSKNPKWIKNQKEAGKKRSKNPEWIKNNAKAMKKRSGPNSNLWKDGRSFGLYCPKFNMRRKKAVRNFFNNTCLACGKLASENVVGAKVVALSVHHIDHDKEQGCNGKPFNLVPLCYDCHEKELHHEEEYKKYINNTLEEGFKWGVWNKEEYIKNVMYPED